MKAPQVQRKFFGGISRPLLDDELGTKGFKKR
jgi:hypothetical protein